jgi:hypothetical protein
MTQVVGGTDAPDACPRAARLTSFQSVFATQYCEVLGIHPATTLPDHQGLP